MHFTTPVNTHPKLSAMHVLLHRACMWMHPPHNATTFLVVGCASRGCIPPLCFYVFSTTRSEADQAAKISTRSITKKASQ